jgi:hypothetical protein
MRLVRWLGLPLPLQWVLGVPLMLVVGLSHLASHMVEQSHRQLVLANGTATRGSVRQPSGLEWVTVDWRDAAGRPRTGTAWTGKPFARLVKEGRAPATVDIRYLDAPAIEPVIVGEAAERERVNRWWLRADAGMVAIASGMLAWGALVFFWFSRAPKPGES